MSFEDIVDHLQVLLKSIEVQDQSIIDLTKSALIVSNTLEYPERQQVFKKETIKTIIDDVQQDQQVLTIGNVDLSDESSCIINNQYVINSYLDEQDDISSAIFPNNQAVCMDAQNCALCNNGTWEWQDVLDACKGLRCNL
jgi:hypothetical protein